MARFAHGPMHGWMINTYGSPEDLTLLPIQLAPPTGAALLIKVEAAALNPLDIKLMTGVLSSFMPTNFPFVPGSDVCGRVVGAGPDADFSQGERVVAMTSAHGAMATHVLCDESACVVPAPEQLSARSLASLPEAGMTAMAVLRAAGSVAGRTVAIVGATGGVGLIACQLAASLGATVLATVSRAEDEALVRGCGASHVLDYSRLDAIDALKTAWPDGVDVLVDLVHQSEELVRCAGAVRSGGKMVCTLPGPDPAAFVGVQVSYVRLAPHARDLAMLVHDLEEKRITAQVTRSFPFLRVRQAYAALAAGGVRGKLVVDMP
ncbi:NADP-dependent oxidoreductase [Dyella sp.]|jgi:NADPH:quinone reductase-like Zn-dependent oxidoreductase|uniref:NADP-dependent oxidoreductase n=1 Tax=Dyella sp. TaxID=1869338 RepID=UPI002D785941|nr:NADP-dependent oxidoreductase [Dyella sp.]HET6433790.1 NADP-dependent oxidoreductase [Dyella sp.]